MRRYGVRAALDRLTTAGLVVAIFVAVSSVGEVVDAVLDSAVLTLGSVIVLGGTAVVAVRVVREEDEEPEDELVARIHERYLEHNDEERLDRELSVVLDPERTAVLDAVDDIDGLGEEVGLAVASDPRIEDLDALAELDPEALTDIPHVGEVRAERLVEEVSR